MLKALLKGSETDDVAQALSVNQLSARAGEEILVVFLNVTGLSS